tara:strand:- start:254 stop:505 length:252 start_codon:yes stop_codon:yes gene_type:complete
LNLKKKKGKYKMKSETLNQLKKDSDKNNSIELKTALRIEYNSKIFYWKAQEKKAKQYSNKYSSIVLKLDQEIKHLERKKENER